MTNGDDLTDAFMTASRALVGVAVHSVAASPVEITVTQFRFLVLVADEARSIGDIAAHLGVNQSNASRHCDRLQRLGLVERSRVARDARVVSVDLTDQGRTVVEAVWEQRRRDVARLLGAIPKSSARTVVRALEAFNEAALAQEQEQEPWARAPW